MLNLIKKLAITQLSNIANVIQLDNVMSGVDGASTFGYSLTPTAVQVNDNQRQQYKFTHQLDIRTLDPSSADRAKLSAIESESSTVDVAGLTPDGWLYLRGKLTRNDQYDEIIGDRFVVTTDTPSGPAEMTLGYIAPTTHYAGENLLAGGNILSATAGSTAFLSYSVSGEEVTITRITAGDNPVLGLVRYHAPFPGEVITFSLNLVNASPSAFMTLTFLDSSDATISSSTQEISGTGIKSVTGTMPSGIASFRVSISVNNNPGSVITISRPMIALGVNTTFTL